MLYAAKINKENICKIFLEHKADANFTGFVDTDEGDELFCFDSIFVMQGEIPIEVKYETNEKGECWVPRKYFSSDVVNSEKTFKNKIGITDDQGLFISLTLESYLEIENKLIKFRPKIAYPTAMYYAIKNQNIQLIETLSQYGYDFSKLYVISSMVFNFAGVSRFSGKESLSMAWRGFSQYQANGYLIKGHDIYVTVPPVPAVFYNPLQHAISINSNKDIIDLIRQNTK
jgi:hypothetical protein